MNQFMERYTKLGETFDATTIIIKPSFRINTLKISEKDLIHKLKKQKVVCEKIPFLENAYWYQSEFSLASSVEYLLGYIYIQELASQFPAKVLLQDIEEYKNNHKEIIVLDMCSAPGSKTTQIAQILNDEVPIVALDLNLSRLNALKNNVERMGLKSIITYKKDGRYSDDLKKKFTHILLDAPCSGNFCVQKNFFDIRNLEGIKGRATLQKELLISAYKSLADEGTLVYSTCSLEPEEDELIIDWFINEFEDMKLQKIDLPIGDKGLTEVFGTKLDKTLSLTKRFWPHKTNTEGFFIAKMKKLTNDNEKDSLLQN
jgi:NOL1/NOP2/sun family putative RNA methylase